MVSQDYSLSPIAETVKASRSCVTSSPVSTSKLV